MSRPSNFFIGVDGGASKTCVAIVDGDSSEILSSASCGSSNKNSVGQAEALNQLRLGIHEALRKASVKLNQVRAICMGLSGVDSELDKALANQWVEQIFNEYEKDEKHKPTVFLYNDATIALASGTNGRLHGCVVICGTGTISVGYNEHLGRSNSSSVFSPEPQTYRTSGWGPLLGDEGSGYAIASDILRAVVKAADGRGEATSLLQGVLDHLKLSNPQDLIPWAYSDYKWERIAALYPLAEEHASKGDAVAQRIIDSAINSLIHSVYVVAKTLKLDQDKDPFTVVLSGGILTHTGSMVGPKVQAELQKRLQNAIITFPQIKPEVAAALLARNLTLSS